MCPEMDETTVALVADAARAHLFRVEGATGGWTPLETLSHPEHGSGPQGGPAGRHRLEAGRFAKHLAAELTRRYDDRTFHRLVLVAPPEFMGLLREELPERVAGSVLEELTEDLSRVRPDQLAARVPVPHG
jgi:protein required for attachment to host cells